MDVEYTAADRPQMAPGTLYVVATPIGHARDITLRALDVLHGADQILCEDTRMSAKLLRLHKINTPLLAYHEHNAAQIRPRILARLAAGDCVALISDAGTPLVSDPGYRLVSESVAAGHAVVPLPGASAPLAALAAAGLPTDRFTFLGFPPAKSAARQKWFAALSAQSGTLIFFESARRLADCLADASGALGDRPCTVARELTKKFEEFRRGSLVTLAAAYAQEGPPKGEIVVLLGPAPTSEQPDMAALQARLRVYMANAPLKVAASQLAEETGVPRRTLYALGLDVKRLTGSDGENEQ